MKQGVWLKLEGKRLDTGGRSVLSIRPGLNVIGMPLMSYNMVRVSDLLRLEGLRNNATSIIVADGDMFKVVSLPGDDGDFRLAGGQAFIINARQKAEVPIVGTTWRAFWK